jgi:hypothetical protein
VNRIERAIRARFPEIGRIYIEARRVGAASATQSIDVSAAEAAGATPVRPPMPSPPVR